MNQKQDNGDGIRASFNPNGEIGTITDTSKQRCDNGSDYRQERHIQTATERKLSENKSERDGREYRISADGSVSSGFVTNPNSDGQHGSNSQHEINPSERRIKAQCNIEQMGGDAPNAECNGRGENNRIRESRIFDKNGPGRNWENFPTQSPICGGDDGLPTNLDGITFSKWRNESIKAFGNAIVPQVALQIFKSVQEYETLLQQ